VHVTRNSSNVISGATSKAGAIMAYLITPLLNQISTIVTTIAIIISLFTINLFVALTAFIVFGVLYAENILLINKKLSVNLIILNLVFIQMVKSLQEGLGGNRDVFIYGGQVTYEKIFKKERARGITTN
jgi:hypothetical protein